MSNRWRSKSALVSARLTKRQTCPPSCPQTTYPDPCSPFHPYITCESSAGRQDTITSFSGQLSSCKRITDLLRSSHSYYIEVATRPKLQPFSAKIRKFSIPTMIGAPEGVSGEGFLKVS
eukprot:135678-Rhodomonas_salina.2